MEKSSRPRFIPASKLPMIDAEISFIVPDHLRTLVDSVGLAGACTNVTAGDGLVTVLEVSTKVSLEFFQAVLRAPETSLLEDSDDEGSDDDGDLCDAMDVVDLEETQAIERPHKRFRNE